MCFSPLLNCNAMALGKNFAVFSFEMQLTVGIGMMILVMYPKTTKLNE